MKETEEAEEQLERTPTSTSFMKLRNKKISLSERQIPRLFYYLVLTNDIKWVATETNKKCGGIKLKGKKNALRPSRNHETENKFGRKTIFNVVPIIRFFFFFLV